MTVFSNWLKHRKPYVSVLSVLFSPLANWPFVDDGGEGRAFLSVTWHDVECFAYWCVLVLYMFLCVCIQLCISYHPATTIFVSSPAKPRTSLRQPDHRGRGVGRGGGGGGRGLGGQHGNFRQERDMRDTQSEGKSNQSSNQNKPINQNTPATRKSYVPSERWVVISGNHKLDWLDCTNHSLMTERS